MLQNTNEPKRLPEYLEENELLSKRAVYTDLRGWKFSKIVIRSFTHYITLGVYQLKQGRFLHKGASQLLWIIWTFCTQGTIQHLKGWNTVKTCAKHNPSSRGLLLQHCKHLQLLKCQFQETQFCNWISWWLILTWNIYRNDINGDFHLQLTCIIFHKYCWWGQYDQQFNILFYKSSLKCI